ncbi:synaptonemal complex protein 2-like isoform X2 [Silurus meridionalis]|uniref:synaptonemal complex protein 2-like isoform X2 n=1 Tax=Silurus meridionalis TaxID=175797 RepID=UPI001EE9F942|nr:synaptonemal complex protein 2-like isoform X2 [Silurus meridionalis]
MSISSKLEVAFATNNVTSVVLCILGEKSSASIMDQLDDVACRDLHKNEFKNVTLILRAVEQVISKDEDYINQLVSHGLLIKMLTWFEMVCEHLKVQQKPNKAPMRLMEVFCEVSMKLCQSNTEGKIKILEILILRFGAVVIDQDVHFNLRLEAIKTINTMLDSAPKETRKKICQSDHNALLEELAKVIIHVGDYEMQVAISEALCRMTPKKLRGELAGKWFSYRSFASSFTKIRVKEFETDCRIFLNELNSYFGSLSRVFSYPCITAFLDTTEMFKPDDELLQKFWIDFNIGTSCIGFYVNDPQESLWELIHLPIEAVSSYSLQECGDMKILSIHMLLPVHHGKISGKMVQVTFDCRHDIQTAVNKVFAGGDELQLIELRKHAVFTQEDSGIPNTPTEIKQPFTSHRAFPAEETYSLIDDSDTEVTDAKAVVFSQSVSSNGSASSVKSFPSAKLTQKRKTRMFYSETDCCVSPGEKLLLRHKPQCDYTRKRTRMKSKFKVLPISSPSSSEEKLFKESTPIHKQKIKRSEGMSKSQNLDLSHQPIETIVNSRFQDKMCIGDSATKENPVGCIEEQTFEKEKSELPNKRPLTSVELDACCEDKEQLSFSTLKPRKLFISPSLESAKEAITQAMIEDDESEEELSTGIMNAFDSFKAHLREQFSSRYKKTETKSLRSLTDCQKTVSTLLKTVHDQRLIHLDCFQNAVLHQLGQLEQNCLSLKNIEKETVGFWHSLSDTVRAFCNKQQKRLESIELLGGSIQAHQRQAEGTEAMSSMSTAVPDAETEDKPRQ